MLFSFGGVILWVGWTAVQRQEYDLEWKASTPMMNSQGVAQFRGGDAVRIGCSLMGFGGMLAAWGLALSTSSFHQRCDALQARLFSKGLVCLSLACLLCCVGCLFPLWHLRSLPFVATGLLVMGFLLVAHKVNRPSRGQFFLAMILVAILAGSFDPGAGFAVAAGILAGFALLIHVLALFPNLEIKVLGES
jgi:hypothetical protein